MKVCGVSKMTTLHRGVARRMRLSCGCRAESCSAFAHSQATIGGKRFNAGERLLRGRRCGSVITAVIGGRSVYGIVKKFNRVFCSCRRVHDFAVVTWFPRPTYPDGDPLTVKIELAGVVDVNNINTVSVIALNDIQPSRVLVEINTENHYMFVMRMEGLDRNVGV